MHGGMVQPMASSRGVGTGYMIPPVYGRVPDVHIGTQVDARRTDPKQVTARHGSHDQPVRNVQQAAHFDKEDILQTPSMHMVPKMQAPKPQVEQSAPGPRELKGHAATENKVVNVRGLAMMGHYVLCCSVAVLHLNTLCKAVANSDKIEGLEEWTSQRQTHLCWSRGEVEVGRREYFLDHLMCNCHTF